MTYWKVYVTILCTHNFNIIVLYIKTFPDNPTVSFDKYLTPSQRQESHRNLLSLLYSWGIKSHHVILYDPKNQVFYLLYCTLYPFEYAFIGYGGEYKQKYPPMQLLVPGSTSYTAFGSIYRCVFPALNLNLAFGWIAI